MLKNVTMSPSRLFRA